MPNSDMKTIRILNIVLCVLTALAIVGFLIGGALMVAGASYVDSDSFSGMLEQEIQGYQDEQYFDDYPLDGPGYGYDYDTDEIIDEGTDAAAAIFAILGVFVMFAAVLSVVPLIASIIGIRNASRAKKMGVIFGWGLAGAIVCFLTGRLISCILFVVAIVKASSVKKGFAAAEAAGYVASPYAPAPEAPQFVSYGQPAQPVQQAAPQVQPEPQPVQYYQVPAEPVAQPVQADQQPAQQAPEIQYYSTASTYEAPKQETPEQ